MSTERLRAAFEGMAVGMILKGAEGETLESNPALRRMLGYGEEELRGMVRSDYTHPEDAGRDAQLYRQLLAGERDSFRMEKRYVRKDGSVMWGRLSVSRIKGAGGEPAFAVGVVEDITESREAAQEIERLNRQNRLILDSAGEGIYGLDTEGKTTFVNPAATAMTGFDPEDLIGKSQHEIVHHSHSDGTSYPREECPIYAALTDGEIHHVDDEVFWRKDGSSFPVEYTSTPIREDGEVTGAVVTFIDTTERKGLEEALKQSEERYRAVVEQTIEGLYLGAADTKRVLESNAAFQTMLAYTAEELCGMHIYEFVAHDQENIDSVFQSILDKGHHFIGERKYRRKDGSIVDVETSATVISYDNREVLCTVVRDITERKKTEEALRRGESSLAAAQRIAHLGNWDYDVTKDQAWWSDEMYRIFGFAPRQFVPRYRTFLSFVHPNDRDLIRRSVRKALYEQKQGSVDYRVVRPDGQIRVVQSRYEVVRDICERAVKLVGTVHDITELKEAEERLRESEERYRRQSRELGLLHRVRTVLAQELDLPSVLRKVVEAIAETYGYTQVSAYVLEGEELVLQHQVGYREVIERIPLAKGISGRAVRTGEPILLEDVRSDPDFLGAIEGLTSEICVPLFDEDEAVGFINVESTGGARLTRKDLELMVTLGDHVGVALSRARLHTQVRRSEERLRSLADSAFEGILITDEGEILEANRALTDMLGYGLAELVGRSALEFVPPEHRDLVRQKIAAGAEEPYEIIGLRKDGTLRDLEVRGRAFSYQGRSVRVTAVRDITGRKAAEERLMEAEKRYRTLVEQIPAVTFIDRAEGSEAPLYVSPQIEGMLGYTPQEWMAGRLWRERLHPDDRERILASDERFEADGEPVDEEYRLLAKEGSVVWVREETVLVRGEGGEPLYVQGIMNDITEKKQAEERLEHQALHDSLTGLPNRQLLLDRLGQALRRTRRRRDRRVAVLFMDLDDFKSINDSLGHEAGDLLLVVMAERLRHVLRPEDTLGRFGGDEFVVLLEDVDGPDEPVRVAERIAEGFRSPFVLEGRELYARPSIGIALGGERAEGPEDLLRNADTAMYQAKDEGSGYSVFDQSMYERALDRLEAENGLRRAIEREEFVVHYQPIVNLQTGAVWGVEALVRWEHPERGLLDPDGFIPLAEESGLVVPMGELVLEEACRRAVEWQREFPRTPPLVMSVNLSGRQLRRPDLHEVIGRVLAETELPASSLGLDITETVYISALDANTAALDRLKALGIRISLDDFGSGYSSLSYLKRLPADILKIDKSFTKGLGVEVEDTAIVQTVVDLAHILGMEVVGEGVEIEEQETLLKEMGCDMAQGVHFARPLPPDEVVGFLSG